MSTITFNVTFYGGMGTAIFDGENIPAHKTINSTDPDTSFEVDQSPGGKLTTVAGTVPAGDAAVTGQVTVEVSENGTVLSSAADNTYEAKNDGSGGIDYSFNSLIAYAVV